VIKANSADWILVDGKAVGLQAYEIIRSQIIHGALQPGMRISETEVSRNLQTSRQPVREAFIRLRYEGLVEVRPQRGTFVTLISTEAVSDARFIREAVEADIVKLLVEKSNPDLIATLRAQISEQRKVGENQLRTFLELDDRFHRTLAGLAGKSNAWAVIGRSKAHFDRVRYLTSARKPVQPIVDQHEAIIDAIEQRDSRKAEAAIRSHLREILRDLPKLVSTQPEIFVGSSGR
jgi:DNA-binding GntR family transcriptional regulator